MFVSPGPRTLHQSIAAMEGVSLNVAANGRNRERFLPWPQGPGDELAALPPRPRYCRARLEVMTSVGSAVPFDFPRAQPRCSHAQGVPGRSITLDCEVQRLSRFGIPGSSDSYAPGRSATSEPFASSRGFPRCVPGLADPARCEPFGPKTLDAHLPVPFGTEKSLKRPWRRYLCLVLAPDRDAISKPFLGLF